MARRRYDAEIEIEGTLPERTEFDPHVTYHADIYEVGGALGGYVRGGTGTMTFHTHVEAFDCDSAYDKAMRQAREKYGARFDEVVGVSVRIMRLA